MAPPARLAAALIAAVAVGCGGDASRTRVLLTLVAESAEVRPDHATLTWFRGTTPIIADQRVPATGRFPPSGDLATVVLDLQSAEDQARKVLVRGFSGDTPIAIGAARITPAPGQQVSVTVVLHRELPDSDHDGVPDVIDDRCPGAAACPGPAPDAGVPDARPPDAPADRAATPEAPPDLPGPPPPDAPVEAPPPAPPDAPAERVAPELRTGLVAYWRFDEPIGSGAAQDSSGNGNVGTVKGANLNTDWVQGKVGGALKLNGTSSWVWTPYAKIYDSITDKVTVAGFVNRAANQTLYHPFVHRQVGTTPGDRFLFGTNADHLILEISNSTVQAPTTLPLGVWVHVAGTYDGTTMRLYVDGKQVATATRADKLVPEPNGFTIGAQLDGTSQDAPLSLVAATIDELGLWQRALDAAEVAQLAAGQRP